MAAVLSKSVIERYKRLFGKDKLTAADMERVNVLHNEYSFKDNDAIWSVVIILEMYLRTVERFGADTKTAFHDAIIAYKDRGGVFNLIQSGETWQFLVAGCWALAAAVVTGAFMFYAGLTINPEAAAWLGQQTAYEAIDYILAIPCGGLVFFLCGAVSVIGLVKIGDKVYYAENRKAALKSNAWFGFLSLFFMALGILSLKELIRVIG